MPIALIPNYKWDYVLKRQRKLPKEKQTIFHLKSFDGEQWINYYNQKDFGSQTAYSLMVGLLGWDNFKNDLGVPVDFEKTETGDFAIDNIPKLRDGDIFELSTAIIKRNIITEDEIKNSQSPDALSQESSSNSTAKNAD